MRKTWDEAIPQNDVPAQSCRGEPRSSQLPAVQGSRLGAAPTATGNTCSSETRSERAGGAGATGFAPSVSKWCLLCRCSLRTASGLFCKAIWDWSHWPWNGYGYESAPSTASHFVFFFNLDIKRIAWNPAFTLTCSQHNKSNSYFQRAARLQLHLAMRDQLSAAPASKGRVSTPTVGAEVST